MIRMKGESFAIACNRSLVKIPPRMGGNLIVFVRIVFSLRFPPEWGGILLCLFGLFFHFSSSDLLFFFSFRRFEYFATPPRLPGRSL